MELLIRCGGSLPEQKRPNKRFTEQFTVKTPQKNIPESSKATSRASSYTPESELNCKTAF